MRKSFIWIGMFCVGCAGARRAPAAPTDRPRAATCYLLTTTMDLSARIDSLFPDDPSANVCLDTMELDTIAVESPRAGRPVPQFVGLMHSTRTLAATWVRTADSLSVGWSDQYSEWELVAGITRGRLSGRYFWRSPDLGTFYGQVEGISIGCPPWP